MVGQSVTTRPPHHPLHARHAREVVFKAFKIAKIVELSRAALNPTGPRSRALLCTHLDPQQFFQYPPSNQKSRIRP
ncbi:hypothetical protein DPMN_159175 [Dreissena polymorpha]|uniref:Uncharacterized protein n=1 Tax=Dreissena polymorpha TaxID=45954 RepID=A0A9D4EL74_DREPO|nr:hypothetical protein DPMN_159175 [Dreissena polymorpha]